MPSATIRRISIVISFLGAVWSGGRGSPSEPAVSLVLGASQTVPYGPANVSGDYGTRLSLAFSSSLMAGELRIPMEWGVSLRTAVLGFSGWFDRDVFTDLQIPFIFHGAPTPWKRLELLALWTPSYTLDMTSTSSFAGRVSNTRTLRTRFNMGLGAGMQGVLPWGIRLRGHWVYNLFSPYPASRLTWSDLGFEATFPLAWNRKTP